MPDDAMVPPMIRQGQILQQMSRDIVAGIDPAWIRLIFRAAQTASHGEATVQATDRRGRARANSAPPGIGDQVSELRQLMYRPGTGTWFTMWIEIDDRGRVSSRFDYDSEPDWARPADPRSYVEDLQKYPRDPEYTPAWLAARIAPGESSS